MTTSKLRRHPELCTRKSFDVTEKYKHVWIVFLVQRYEHFDSTENLCARELQRHREPRACEKISMSPKTRTTTRDFRQHRELSCERELRRHQELRLRKRTSIVMTTFDNTEK
ncbi:hypothetical protein PoB_003734800 [Plakobranchus ocellatus]|uniref:Uncharacterized protein n=1 Tax=Plakobranchus ocellatus TaxID=259542 RepID=A0AAV4AWF3_9GAST|nr:hypothetical protein PoB_003734800 [Plakobranchus ocellatus]